MAEMTVQIVTPDGLKYDHHAKFILVKTPNDSHVDWVAVNGGIIEIKDNLVTIVADSAERERDIDLSRAERAKKRAEKAIEEAKEQHRIDEVQRAQVALRRALNRINVGSK